MEGRGGARINVVGCVYLRVQNICLFKGNKKHRVSFTAKVRFLKSVVIPYLHQIGKFRNVQDISYTVDKLNNGFRHDQYFD
jgi:hypothetical protein